MVVTLDFHDFSIENNNMFYLEQLREHYPNLKVSMFYIPVDSQHYDRLIPSQKDESKRMIKQAVEDGWIELIPHGLTHIFGEFHNATYDDTMLVLDAVDEYFREWGVPYIHGFCAPNWLISPEAIRCLDEYNWWLAVDKNQPDTHTAKRMYIYNWDIADSFPQGEELVMGHGHISHPSKNNLPECIRNLMQIPEEAQFKFVSEVMNEQQA